MDEFRVLEVEGGDWVVGFQGIEGGICNVMHTPHGEH